MKISIITICYNSEKTIQDTIESVVNQDYEDIEYIIIDGNSTDGTLAILKQYERQIATIISENDNGLYDAINKGILNATGEVIGLIHADDLLADSTVISKIANVFSTIKIDAIYGDLQYVNQFDTSKVVRNWVSGEYTEGLFLNGWMPPHPTFYVKKSCYDDFGKYNLDFTSAADYELMLRFIHKHKIRLGYIPDVLVKMRVGGKSNASLKNRIIANLEDRKAWKVNGITPKFYTLYAKPLSKLLQFFK